MRRLALILALLAAAPAPAPADDPAPPPRIVAPATSAPYKLVRVRVEGAVDSAAIVVEPDELADTAADADGRGATFTGPPGRYVVRAVTLDGKQLRWLKAVVTIGDPPPPPPPGPGPPPPNPGPGPAPPPAPVPVDKLRVLILYDTFAALSREQQNTLSSTAIRGYLSSRCLADGDGRPAWRVWPKDMDASREAAAWQDALSMARDDARPTPKVAIFAGPKMTVEPLPATEAATLDLLRTYGGR